jgi:hypothetical protein
VDTQRVAVRSIAWLGLSVNKIKDFSQSKIISPKRLKLKLMGLPQPLCEILDVQRVRQTVIGWVPCLINIRQPVFGQEVQRSRTREGEGLAEKLEKRANLFS